MKLPGEYADVFKYMVWATGKQVMGVSRINPEHAPLAKGYVCFSPRGGNKWEVWAEDELHAWWLVAGELAKPAELTK